MKIEQAIQYLEVYKERFGNLDILIDETITNPDDTTFRKVVRHDCSFVVTTNENREYIVSVRKEV